MLHLFVVVGRCLLSFLWFVVDRCSYVFVVRCCVLLLVVIRSLCVVLFVLCVVVACCV